jgi:hypothetical protein
MNMRAEKEEALATEIEQRIRGNTAEATTNEDKQPQSQHSDAYKAKYDVLRGKFDAEVPVLHANIRELKQQLAQAQQMLTQQRAVEATQKSRQDEISKPIEDLREAFGDEVARPISEIESKMQKRYDELEAIVKSTTAQPVHVQEQQQSVERMERETFERNRNHVINAVSAAGFNFLEIDNDPSFAQWLDSKDESGIVRRETMNYVFSNGLTDQTAQFYIQWKSSQQRSGQRAAKLEEQIQPGNVVNDASSSTGQAKKVYSKAEWDELYASTYTSSKFTASAEGEKKATALIKELDEALIEGRVKF